MGQMYAMQCDLCDEIQVKKKPHELEGSVYTENGAQKFACAKCKARMKAAFALKKEGIEDPLGQVAGLVERAETAERELDGARALLAGDHLGAARELGLVKDPTFGGRRVSPGASVPLIGSRTPEDRDREFKPHGIGHEEPRDRKERRKSKGSK